MVQQFSPRHSLSILRERERHTETISLSQSINILISGWNLDIIYTTICFSNVPLYFFPWFLVGESREKRRRNCTKTTGLRQTFFNYLRVFLVWGWHKSTNLDRNCYFTFKKYRQKISVLNDLLVFSFWSKWAPHWINLSLWGSGAGEFLQRSKSCQRPWRIWTRSCLGKSLKVNSPTRHFKLRLLIDVLSETSQLLERSNAPKSLDKKTFRFVFTHFCPKIACTRFGVYNFDAFLLWITFHTKPPPYHPWVPEQDP